MTQYPDQEQLNLSGLRSLLDEAQNLRRTDYPQAKLLAQIVVRTFSSLAEKHPGNLQILSTLGEALDLIGDRTRAKKTYETALRVVPRTPQDRDIQSKIMTKLGRHTKAIKLADQAWREIWKQNPKNHELQHTYRHTHLEAIASQEAQYKIDEDKKAIPYKAVRNKTSESPEQFTSCKHLLLEKAFNSFLKEKHTSPTYNPESFPHSVHSIFARSNKKRLERENKSTKPEMSNLTLEEIKAYEATRKKELETPELASKKVKSKISSRAQISFTRDFDNPNPLAQTTAKLNLPLKPQILDSETQKKSSTSRRSRGSFRF